MAKQGNIIPVYREFLGDIETPVSAYFKIEDKSFSYLLESAELGEEWGRYSFIGYKPYLVVKGFDKEIHVEENGLKRVIKDINNPLDVVKTLSRDFKPVTVKGLAPFQGGFVGYVNYDVMRKWERLPGLKAASPDLPEVLFCISKRLIVFDHLTYTIKIVAFARLTEGKDLREAYDEARGEIKATLQELRRPLPDVCFGDGPVISKMRSNFKKDEFEAAVRKAKEYIVSGDIIQTVLSQRFSARIKGDEFGLYRQLRSINPSPYMFYLNFGDVKLIGASPEILVRLTDRKVEVRPIAGTRPRGKSIEADQALERELLSDPKERAEHIMLVDLGRNDVGKISRPGSVTVPRLMEIERYSHVMHIVSNVEGVIRPGVDSFDVFMSTFPAGTVSGAPKLRAMEIINELEGSPRGPYAGAVGYFGFNGDMDFCITIRTIAVIKDRLFIQTGAGIVADSTPEGEYNETLKKGRAMFKAIEKVIEHDSINR
jgi:anthranilate synthase component 1